MDPKALPQEDNDHQSADVKVLHGTSALEPNSFLSAMQKDSKTHRMMTDSYVKHWEASHDNEAQEARTTQYMSLTNNYYDIATDQYEAGWAQSFHFCRFADREPFLQALARHEHYMAHMINLREGMNVLDVGCGVGRPAIEIATFTGCQVVGLNNNNYQIERAIAYTKKEGLSDQVSFVKGDFMHMKFPENSFDAVFAIEATVHAPSLQGVYEQIYRVLKPGGRFGVYEWVMTDKFDDSNPAHCAIRLGIQRGNGIASMKTGKHAEEAIKAAGFILEHSEDLAARPDSIRWYYPITGKLKRHGLKDLIGNLIQTRIGRSSVGILLSILELVRIVPAGTAKTSRELALAADNLVAGGEEKIFTPMHFMIGKKQVQLA